MRCGSNGDRGVFLRWVKEMEIYVLTFCARIEKDVCIVNG